MRFPSIYKIVNKLNNKYYVGSSIKPQKRWISHKKCLNDKTHHNDYLQNAWIKYGCDNFIFIIEKSLPSNTTEEELLKEEQIYLDTASKDSLSYNLTFVANRPTMYMSDYSKKKHSDSLKKVPRTKEWKEKISKSHIGIRPTILTLQKMSLAKKGKQQSDAQREACTEGRRKHWDFISPTGQKIHIYDLKRFCKENGLHSGCMYDVASTKRKSHKGWTTEESRKIKKKNHKVWYKNYTFLSPENEIIHISNLKNFCIENNLKAGNMYSVYSEKRKSHKGWIKYAVPQP